MAAIIGYLFHIVSTIDRSVWIMFCFLVIVHIDLQLLVLNYQSTYLLKTNSFQKHEFEKLSSTILGSIFQKQMNQMFYLEDTSSQYL